MCTAGLLTGRAVMPQAVPTVSLPNGVAMPALLLGVGTATWMNDTSTAQVVLNGLRAGFPGIDTASHYRNQKGVAIGVALARREGVARGNVWLTTKVEGCGNSRTIPVRQGHCFADTLAVVERNLVELSAPVVDLTLLHSPPCVPNASWVDGCMGNPASDLIYPRRCRCAEPEPCAMIREQWRALEHAYAAGKSRAIGVSNFCAACLDCLSRAATTQPHVNMFKMHAGMGPDADGLVSATRAHGAIVQAYQPLGHGDPALLRDDTLFAIARRHNRSTAQVLLKWVVQLGHPVATSTTNPTYMAEDLSLWGWQLGHDEMRAIDSLRGHNDDPSGGMCA